MYPFFNRNVTIGIDICDKKISALQLQTRFKRYHIQKLGVQPLPSQAVYQNRIKDWEEVAIALRELVQVLSLHSKPVALALPLEMVKQQSIELPINSTNPTEDFRIKEQLQAFWNQQPPATDYVDHLPQTFNPNKNTLVTLAANKAYVDKYVSMVESVGLPVRVVDMVCYALYRAVLVLYGKAPRSHQVILWVRENMASLVVFSEANVSDYQTWSIQANINFLQSCLDPLHAMQMRNPHLNEILICANDAFSEKLKGLENNHWRCYRIKPFPAFKLKESLFYESLIALGLAMSVYPRW